MSWNNKAYHGLLSALGEQIFNGKSTKEMKVIIKDYDHYFHMENGVHKSISEVPVEEKSRHFTFVKDMAVALKVKSDYISDEDILYSPNVHEIFFTTQDGVTKLVCSRCGCSTRRVLTLERREELDRVAAGADDERSGCDSFRCIHCFKKEIEWNLI